MTRKQLFCLFMTAALFIAPVRSYGQTKSPSPFYHLQSMVMYLKHGGGDLKIKFRARHDSKTIRPNPRAVNVPAILMTIYNPEEKAVRDIYWRDDKRACQFSQEIVLPKAAAGIWQLRITGEQFCRMGYSVDTVPECERGILPARCWVWHQDTALFSDCYFYLPPRQPLPVSAYVYNGELTVSDEKNNIVLKVDRKKASAKIKLPGDQVYRQQQKAINPKWNWFGLGGFPVIYCRTPELARELHASTLPLPDSDRTVPFKFQQRIEAWKATLTPDDLKVPDFQFKDYEKEFISHPESRHTLGLTGILSATPYILKKQHTDPKDPLFGNAPRGSSLLALVYLLNKPYNPYYKQPGIKNRLLLYNLNKLSRQQPVLENGSLYETHSNYAGADGMLQVTDYVAFMLMSPYLTDQERTLWGEGLGFGVRRFFCDRVSCENQSAHWPVKLYAYGKGTGNQLFIQLAKDYIDNLSSPERDIFIRTGYLQESYGPDATYQGLCSSLLSFYHYFSKDPNAAKLVDRIFGLFNHTVAPEPGGICRYGASGFSHRTMGGWNQRQYEGGTPLMAAVLENAACWHQHREAPWPAQKFRQWLKWKSNFDPYPIYLRYSISSFAPYWKHFPEITPIPNAKFPAEKMHAGEFRNFNDEFVFCRQKEYYCGLYTGRTSRKLGTWTTGISKPDANWNMKKDALAPKTRRIRTPLQGPQIFWTPEYGVALTSMNWNAYTFWTSWLLNEDGTCELPSYNDNKTEIFPEQHKTVFHLNMPASKCRIDKTVIFGPEELTVLSQMVTRPAKAGTWREQIPFPIKKQQTIQFSSSGNQWLNEIPEKVSAFRIVNAAKAGIVISFSRPVALVRRPDSLDHGIRIGSFTVRPASETDTFSYTVKACR